jgi:hypothetical protein
MLINELRLGNWLQRLDGSLFQVTPTDFTLIPDRSEYLQPKPIPLTEEILLKTGFEKVKNKIDIFELGRLRIWVGGRGAFLAYLIEEDTTSAHYIPNGDLNYLHQLQNLYFALTGEELKIELC